MRFPKKSLLMASLLMPFTMQTQAQLKLDNYVIPSGKPGAAVGKVITSGKALVTGDTSGLFMISKNTLRLKKNKSLPAGAYKFEVAIAAGDEKGTFTLVKDEFHQNKVIAHRGAWKNQPGSQNSLSSLKDAIKLGCAGSEFDVWLSSDEKLVLSHDAEIGGKVVEKTPLAELQTIQLDNGDRVPTLEEYLDEGMKQNGTKLVLELKPSKVSKERGKQLAASAVEMVRAKQAQGWILYISFDYDILLKILELDPYAKVAYLNGEKSPAQLKADKIWGFDYNYGVVNKDISILKDARSKGITTNVWTVNKAEQMDQLLNAGVDFLTTDEPELALEKVKTK
ncbi:glycerophosphodiester phosphodiesterase family protein [Chitinophaga horti]|uniref:Glycerophosphodiester phosphodiesterase family protein n=1 Tax=Chitinophaga horti TaxID=2920382 RepID=A0ABY6J281_9BACT|nr:glycerophosphodiester phosphodiesterase family protein [Chitinophaga horti]UYQ93768.1 glycerophosphodiester phosphodiesterase family protein [Chitinophaga horti]